MGLADSLAKALIGFGLITLVVAGSTTLLNTGRASDRLSVICPVATSTPSKLVWLPSIMVPGTMDVSSVIESTIGWPTLFHDDPTLCNDPDIDSGDVILLIECKSTVSLCSMMRRDSTVDQSQGSCYCKLATASSPAMYTIKTPQGILSQEKHAE